MEHVSIYVVEDDESIRTMVVYALKESGYEAQGFEESQAFFQAVEQKTPELVLLDIMLPGEDGLSILKRLRGMPKTARVPVIMLTAKATEMDKVRGLDMGADDYVAKPFGILELLSRIRAVVRRTVQTEKQMAEEGSGIFVYQNVRVDEASHTVTVDGREVTLTRKEFKLLCDLMRNQGRVLTRDQIMEKVWGFDYGGATRTVDIHINTLRKKLNDDGSMIQTVRGVGYKIGK
ncbi:MAG TPA: response regulator transcription factor [Candidatus Butyricicoccus stercorigallinarum]|nr:response regulator transcription factor [Candidatus Butyricicoccus stercorigallinarum]